MSQTSKRTSLILVLLFSTLSLSHPGKARTETQTVTVTGGSTVRRQIAESDSVDMRGLPPMMAAVPTLGKKVSVRAGHVFGGMETDYVISSTSSTGGPSQIQVFRPTDTTTPSLNISPPAPNTNLRLLDVIDLDRDGFDDIIAFNANNGQTNPAQGALYVFDKNSLQPKAKLLTESGNFCNGSGGTVFGNTGLVPKIYQRRDGKYNIVVSLSTAGTGFPGSVFFLRANPNGTGILPPLRIDLPLYATCPGQCVNCNDGIEFPAIAVGDIDLASGNGKEVVILSKDRLLVFNEDGTKYYFRQFIDPNHGFTDYTVTDRNGMPLDTTGVQGRRYGHIQIVNDLDGDGKKDLVVLADALPLGANGGVNAPFAILQAFHLDAPTGVVTNGGYEKTIGNIVQIQGANSGLSSAPPEYGLTVDGIQDVDGDGREEVVVSTNTPSVQILKFQNGAWQTIAQLTGTCLDVVKLDRSQSVPDIIVYNAGNIDIYRWNGSSFARRQRIPAGSPPTQFDASNFNLSGPDYEKHGAAAEYFRLIVVNFNGEKYFLQDTKTSTSPCGTIKSFGSINGTPVQGLNMSSNPGRIQFISNLEDPSNSTYLINRYDSTCMVTGTVDPFVQQGDSLVLKPGNQIGLSPSTLNFSAAVGGPNPAAQSITITSSSGPLNYTISSNASWLSVTPGTGTTPGTASASVNLANLTAGTYTATITVKASNGSIATAAATLNLTQAATQITVNPASLSFTATQGGPNPPSQTLNIGSTGSQLQWSVSANTPRLSFNPTSGTTPGTTKVSIDSSGLSANTFLQFTITVSSPSAPAVTVQVGLTITSGGTSNITVSPANLSFTAQQGGPAPSAQSISINSTGSSLNWTASSNASWLSVSPNSGTTPSTATVAVTNTNMAANTYNGVLTVTASNGSSATVQVQLTLTGPPPPTDNGFITNGGFEGGISPWVQSGVASYINNATYAHSGTGSFRLGTDSFAGGGTLYQDFTIPNTASTAKLNFYLYVTSPLLTTVAYDKLYFEITDSSGRILQSLGNFSNLNKGPSGAYVLRGPYDLSAFKGQTIRLRFRSVTSNAGGGTEFHIDDVSVK